MIRSFPNRRHRRRACAIVGAIHGGEHGVIDIQRLIGYGSAQLYLTLMRLQSAGLIEARWEPDPGDRPRRRLYYLAGQS